MSLFPTSFVEDLKTQTDIIQVIGEATPLKKAGATWKGLCPFHQEKTPSFTVSRDKGVFYCFGCSTGGDVVKFVELHLKLSFPEAVRHLAQRAGIQVPESQGTPEERAAAADREGILKAYELAAAFYREQLNTAAGRRARRELEARGLSPETIRTFGYGYAPAAGKDTLQAYLTAQGVSGTVQARSRLVAERPDGRLSDWFRNRLMIPIARDSGAVIAFGGRALDEGQVPKYLNSQESPVYTKGRTLYGLDVTKGAVRKHNYCVLVEGYFDLAQVWQAGVQPVVALCGTALTIAQARTLKRFTSKVVLSLDPDTAGREAAARSSELLVAEGFQVNVALLPAGSDPDTFIRQSGARPYAALLTASRPYLDYLLDRAAEKLDVNRPESRKAFIDQMLGVAARIPDAAARDQFADRLAHKARITETVVRDEIRKAAAQRRTEAPAVAVPPTVRLRQAEVGLLWALVRRPVEAVAALSHLEPPDREGLVAGPVFELAMSLADVPAEALPDLLRDRLSEGERALLERASVAESAPAAPADCVNALKRDRYKREIAAVQDEIDRLQADPRQGGATLETLWARKKALLKRIEDLAA
jgi:DNA primase